jgi:3'-5' exonuclease
MGQSIIVWDIETVPDLRGFAAANGLIGKSDEEVREAIGEKFPKHVFHSIVCIGALVAHREAERWVVDALGAPHCGERSERELIAAFVGRVAELSPQLVTFNGNSFDLPVLRYRALVNRVAAPVCRCARISTDTLKTRVIYATCFPRSAARERRRSTRFAA